MIYEARTYTAVPGKLQAINDRFANHTVGFFNQYEIGMMGFWTDVIGISNQLTYILTFDNMGEREKKFGAFGADPKWQEVRAETEVDGPLVAQVNNTFMQPTAYSPEPHLTSKLQELRVYDAVPGKLPALNNRFADHTMGLFEKHGMDNVAYWTEVVGTSNRLVYMLGHESLAAREKSFDAFASDPQWQKARAESEKDGPLVGTTTHRILKLTPYSPR